jgi:hypothetical protein
VKRGDRIVRWLWVIGLPLSIVWLSLEDSSRFGAATVGLLWALLTARHAYVRWIRRTDPAGLLTAATLAGALVGPMAVVLMALKVALHSHPVPDYQIDDIHAMLAWIPAGGSLGLLLGAGLVLLRGEGSAGGDE